MCLTNLKSNANRFKSLLVITTIDKIRAGQWAPTPNYMHGVDTPTADGLCDTLIYMEAKDLAFMYAIPLPEEALKAMGDRLLERQREDGGARHTEDNVQSNILFRLAGLMTDKIKTRNVEPLYSILPRDLRDKSAVPVCGLLPIFATDKIHPALVKDSMADECWKIVARFFQKINWTPPQPLWFFGGLDYSTNLIYRAVNHEAARFIQDEVEYAAHRLGASPGAQDCEERLIMGQELAKRVAAISRIPRKSLLPFIMRQEEQESVKTE